MSANNYIVFYFVDHWHLRKLFVQTKLFLLWHFHTVFIRLQATAYNVFFIISCGLQSRATYSWGQLTFFKNLIETSRWHSVFPWLHFIEQTFFLHYLSSFQHHVYTCLLHHRRDYDEQNAVVVMWASLPGLPIKHETCYIRMYLRGLGNLCSIAAYNQMRFTTEGG